MPYSKAAAKREARKIPWPDLRYNPATGEAKLFFSAEEVPEGWEVKPTDRIELHKPGVVLDRDELVAELVKRDIPVKPTWANAHMKRIIDGDVSPTW